MKPKPKIFFIFPYHGVGGVSVLFYRVARYLSENLLADTVLVDYADGTMIKLAKAEKTKVGTLIYSDENKVEIPANSFVVFQSMTPWSMFPNLQIHPEAKMFFWNCHPFNLVTFIPGFRYITFKFPLINKYIASTLLRSWNSKLHIFINLLLKNNAIGFMDGENLDNTIKYNFSFSYNKFLPIPIDIPDENLLNVKKNIDEIKITHVGRLVDFKYFPLKKFLIDLQNLSLDKNFKFHVNIIGSGPYLEDLKKSVDDYPNISLKLLGDLELNKLRSFLLKNTDILVGMGTSALEGGVLKIPTVLLDLSYQEINCKYKYKWLSQTNSYNLAETITKKHENDGLTLEKLFMNFFDKRELIAQECYNYVCKHHSLSSVSNLLINLVTHSTLSYKMLKTSNVMNSGYLYKLKRLMRSSKSS